MYLLSSDYYKNITIKDNVFDIILDDLKKLKEKTHNCFGVYKDPSGFIRKIIYFGNKFSENIIYEYSNKGNLRNLSYFNDREFKIKEYYDYSKGFKNLKEKRFYKNNTFLKREDYINCKIEKITYFKDNVKYCSEFFNDKDDLHPYKVEYYNQAGLKI